MKVVYVAGPFRGKNAWAIEQNIRRAETLALEVWKRGAACICPHANTRFYQHVLPDETWLAGDIEILKRCDAVLMTDDWNFSEGAKGEYQAAVSAGITVLFTLEQLEAWLKHPPKKCGHTNPGSLLSGCNRTSQYIHWSADGETSYHRCETHKCGECQPYATTNT